MENLDEYKQKLLPTDEDQETSLEPRDSRSRSRSRPSRNLVFKSFAICSVILALTITFFAAFSSRWGPSSSKCEPGAGDSGMDNDTGVLTCGSTREEAIAKGCIFDVLAVGWVPAPCYDKQRADKFEKMSTIVSYGSAGTFPWYLDENMTMPIAESDLSTLGDHPVAYTTEEYHQSHCLFVWKSTSDALHEARTQHTSVWALDRISDHHHIRHCLIVLESMPWRYNKSVEVDFGYRDCVRIDMR